MGFLLNKRILLFDYSPPAITGRIPQGDKKDDPGAGLPSPIPKNKKDTYTSGANVVQGCAGGARKESPRPGGVGQRPYGL